MAMSIRRSNLEQTMVNQFLEWNSQGRLQLNPHFQRRAVWTRDAQTYLIDSILQGFPIPKIYLRTTIDVKTKAAIRDVVDGQQRLRAIIEFASDKLVLNRRSERYQGKRYRDLDEDLQAAFLAYPIGVEHLVNASDSFVLQVFSRLNSYTVPLNPAEKRHALYETELKWFVHDITNQLRWFIERYSLVSTTTMVRMEDDAFFAELLNVLVNGVGDSGAAALDAMYKRNLREEQGKLPEADRLRAIIFDAIDWMDKTIPDILSGTTLSKPYQVQMLFAAYVYQKYGLPKGKLEELPPRTEIDQAEQVNDRLSALVQAIETDDEDGPYRSFVDASSGATTRFASRKVRFLAFNRALSKI